MDNCEACRLSKNIDDFRLLYSGNYWQLELNPDQQYLGKSVMTLKRHASNLASLTSQEGAEFWEIVKWFETAVTDAFQPTHFNWSCLMNDSAGAGTPMHVHWHAIPRYRDQREVTGALFVDQRWPKSARDLEPNKPGREVMRAIQVKIQMTPAKLVVY
ncbi:MAG TPA: HIT family protein [Candidatus Acidoferrum sp.]|nr:HIT family protein [Candidatus Acidoferrum sp.]